MLFIMGMPAAAAEPRTTAVSFSDRDAIRNDNEVWMLVDLGLISGYGDGTFRPQNGITREETAKLIAMLCTDEPAAENAPVFLDTALLFPAASSSRPMPVSSPSAHVIPVAQTMTMLGAIS